MAVIALVKLTMLLLVVLLATHKAPASCSTTLTTQLTSKLRSHLVAFLAAACPHKARTKGSTSTSPCAATQMHIVQGLTPLSFSRGATYKVASMAALVFATKTTWWTKRFVSQSKQSRSDHTHIRFRFWHFCEACIIEGAQVG